LTEKHQKAKKIRSWFVYKFNIASLSDSTYARRLCEKYFTKFKLSEAHKSPFSNIMVLISDKRLNKRAIKEHTDSAVHKKIVEMLKKTKKKS